MSLTETYQSRKKLLADNLNSMGVTIASPNDGLTTLINSVLNIEPSISGLDLDTALTLTSSSASITVDKSIILTSKLTASYDDETLVDVDLTGVLTGATVLFKEGNTTLGSGVTGSDGICTATISNLTAGTHTIKAIFEGTDNFNDCESSSINIVVTKPEPASISIVAEKPIMSKGENNKITATVLDSDGNPCEGETVSFSVVDGEDLGTAVTDSAGEAFVYYLGKSVGDIYIQASCRTLVSKTYALRDLWFYDPLTSDSGHWNWDSTTIHTYSNNGVNFKRSMGTGNAFNTCKIDLPSEFEAEITYMGGTAYTIETIFGGMGWTYDVANQRSWGYYRTSLDSTQDQHNITINGTVSVGDVFKFVRQNGTLKIYQNDVEKWSMTAPTPLYDKIVFQTFSNSRNTTLKDLKIKQL